jgi:hypothetical protein
MGMLIIIGVLVLLWVHKSGRPIKLVLTPEEAKAVKAHWWKAAIVELKVWAILFVVGYALAAETLSKEHWHWSIYAFIVWCSLLLFSRLAIWITLAGIAGLFALASLAEVVLHYTIKCPALFGPLVIAVILALLVRFFVMFWKPSGGGFNPVTRQNNLLSPPQDDRVYDYQTDTYVYKEGNREPARIRWPRDEDRPENVRRRREEEDYFKWKRAEDDYFERKRAEDQRRAENDYFERKRKDDDYFGRLR